VKLTPELQLSLSAALMEAAQRGHEYAGLEHLLLVLLQDRVTRRVLHRTGADVDALERRLDTFLEQEIDVLPERERGEPSTTLAFQRVLARAVAQRQGAGKQEVAGPDVIVSMYAEPESFAVYFLEEEGITRLDLVSYLAHGVSEPGLGDGWDDPGDLDGSDGEEEPEFDDEDDDDDDDEAEAGRDPLATFTQELTELARRGELDPLVGRRRELDRAIHVLARRRKNNPIFVGDSGVGKTALVEGLALRIASGEVPDALADASIYSLDLGSLVAGTRYRGDFENRIKAVIRAVKERPRAILFIDEIHTVVGAGAAGSGTMDASNLLKPALRSGALRCIGATTWEEYRQSFERDRALSRRFQKVEVNEPSVEDTVAILDGLRNRYEEHHGVRYAKPAVRAAAELSARYLRDRALPDKAIDLLDEAGAAAGLAGRKRVTVRRMEEVLAAMAQIPPRQVRGDDRERLSSLRSDLEATVYGQDEAIETLVSAIKVSRAGLSSPDRPVGSFLMTGPTGVGKTEMARQLAATLGVPLLRFDMSEYMERHSVSRLVGAPPGYVGFDRGGLLTEAVAKSPYAVVLLDEIEKAHPDVFNILLQVMDHGSLTDTNGKLTDFRQAILLMTSNVGARELAARRPGFAAGGAGAAQAVGTGSAGADQEAYERMFSPEFRNRLDARIAFRALTPEIMLRIVDKLVGALAEQLGARSVALELTPAARTLLSEKGYAPTFGARPLARVIDQELKRPLTDELLFGALRSGGTVQVGVKDRELDLRVEPAAEPRRRGKRKKVGAS
jgi:ATP-dependent Clp protease ATP-binding subunit ClpA